MKIQEEEEEIISDWKFAAMVIDRFCLIIFTAFTVITTVAVLFSAPHIFVDWHGESGSSENGTSTTTEATGVGTEP